MLPTWVNRSASAHQRILAVWQFDPIWVSAIQAAGVMSFSRFQKNSEKNHQRPFYWVRTSYLVAAVSSATGHLYAVIIMISSSDPSLDLVRVYIPFISRGPSGVENPIASGSWLFLQFDLIIIAVSSLSWAYILIASLSTEKRFVSTILPFVQDLGLVCPWPYSGERVYWRSSGTFIPAKG